MKAIVNYTDSEYARQLDAYTELREKVKGIHKADMFCDFTRCVGYAHYTFSGRCTAALVERLGRLPTSDEVIMLVDNGFSHFGASCTIDSNGDFHGRVNTD